MPTRRKFQRGKSNQTAAEGSPPADESKREKFERIGVPRMNRAIHAIHLLGNLASPAYEWSAQDVKDMEEAIMDALAETTARFAKSAKPEAPAFAFGEARNGKDATAH